MQDWDILYHWFLINVEILCLLIVHRVTKSWSAKWWSYCKSCHPNNWLRTYEWSWRWWWSGLKILDWLLMMVKRKCVCSTRMITHYLSYSQQCGNQKSTFNQCPRGTVWQQIVVGTSSGSSNLESKKSSSSNKNDKAILQSGGTQTINHIKLLFNLIL